MEGGHAVDEGYGVFDNGAPGTAYYVGHQDVECGCLEEDSFDELVVLADSHYSGHVEWIVLCDIQGVRYRQVELRDLMVAFKFVFEASPEQSIVAEARHDERCRRQKINALPARLSQCHVNSTARADLQPVLSRSWHPEAAPKQSDSVRTGLGGTLGQTHVHCDSLWCVLPLSYC